jgi:hypothetical protein
MHSETAVHMQCKSSSPVKETTVKALQFPPSPAAGPTTRPPRTPPSRRSREPLPHRPAATEQRLLGPPGSGVGQPDLHLAVAHPGQVCGLWRRGRAVQQRPVLQAEGAPMARAHRTGPGTQAPRGPDPNPWPPGREGVGGTMCPPGSPPLNRRPSCATGAFLEDPAVAVGIVEEAVSGWCNARSMAGPDQPD